MSLLRKAAIRGFRAVPENWALKFAGVDFGGEQYVQFLPWTLKNADVTFTFWIKSNRAQSNYQETIFFNGAYTTPDGYGLLWGQAGTALTRLWLYERSLYTVWAVTLDVVFTSWTHIGLVLINEGATIGSKSYVNGVLNRSRTGITKGALPTSRAFLASSDVYVPAGPAVAPLNADVYLDEFRAWERVLTDTEILQDKQLTTPNRTNLVAWYPFQERTGTSTKDKSGQGNDGTIHGATWIRR